MNFVLLRDELQHRQLRMPTFRVLTPDADLYEILACQPSGKIAVAADFIGHADRIEACKKYKSFLELGVDKNADLVLCPEYSCPWEVLCKFLSEGHKPRMGKLWILGCESITPAKLKEMKDSVTNATWIHEPVPTTAGTFLDTLAYIMVAPSNAGTPTLVILLQFKTQAMGDRAHAFERDHLIVGNAVYILHNETDNIRLLSCICSDALAFRPSDSAPQRFDLHPYLIFHPQLNPEPRNPTIRAYRDDMFLGHSEHREVITLNWAREFRFLQNGELSETSPYGGSAIYSQAREFNLTDDRVDKNHRKGLYYCFWKDRRTHLCYLNFDEHVFHLRMPKVKQNAPGVLLNRTGPEMIEVLNWKSSQSKWSVTQPADDGFTSMCSSYDGACDYCLDESHTSVDRERLLTLSSALMAMRKDWYDVKSLDSYNAESDERSKRLTFTHEVQIASREFRDKCMARFVALQNEVLCNPGLFPPQLGDISNDCKLSPPKGKNGFRFNLASRTAGKPVATGMFLGDSDKRKASRLKDSLVTGWQKKRG